MQMVRPITIDQTNLTSNVAVNDGSQYSASAVYGLGDRVIDTAAASPTYHLYESLAAGNVGHPLADAAYWLDRGAINQLAMFDKIVGTVTSNAATIDVTVSATTVCNGLALFNLTASQVQVTVTNASGTLYDKTVSLRSTYGIVDWYTWTTQEVSFDTEKAFTDLPSNSGTSTRVQITGTGTVKCGTMALGKMRDLGAGPFYGARGGIIDYSKKTTDDFGNTTLVQRAFAKRWSFQSLVANGDMAGVFRLLSDIRSTPVVWIGSPQFGPTLVYGWARDWSEEIKYPSASLLSLEIEGLT